MSDQAAKLVEQVLSLSADDQRAVRGALRDRRRQEMDEAEHAEILRRSDSVHNGTAVLIDGEQFEQELMDRLRKRGPR